MSSIIRTIVCKIGLTSNDYIKIICIIALIYSIVSCNKIYVEYKDTVYFSKLPYVAQDSLISWVNTRILARRSQSFNKKDDDYMLDLTSNYTYECKYFGPWISAKRITDKTSGKSFDLDYDTPMPIIIVGNDIYTPIEYNLSSIGIGDNTLFNHYKIK